MQILTGLSSRPFIPYQGSLLANTKQKPENKEASIQTRLLHLRAVGKKNLKTKQMTGDVISITVYFFFFLIQDHKMENDTELTKACFSSEKNKDFFRKLLITINLSFCSDWIISDPAFGRMMWRA